MKLGVFLAAWLMIMFGILGLTLGLLDLPINFNHVTLGAIFSIWGGLLLWYRAKKYRGGAATIIGTFILGLAINSLLDHFFLTLPATLKDAFIQASIIIFQILSGTALLKQGHKIHRLKDEQYQIFNPSIKRAPPAQR